MKRMIAAGFVSFLIWGCYYDNEEILYGEQQCSDTTSTYAANVSQIIESNCLQCHSQAAANGGVVLQGYTNVKTYADNGRLMGAITHASGFSPMPKNTPKLTSCDIDAIRRWIENGTQNN